MNNVNRNIIRAVSFQAEGPYTLDHNMGIAIARLGAAAAAPTLAAADNAMASIDAAALDMEGTERALELANERVEELQEAAEALVDAQDELQQLVRNMKAAHDEVLKTLTSMGINVSWNGATSSLKVEIDPAVFRNVITA